MIFFTYCSQGTQKVVQYKTGAKIYKLDMTQSLMMIGQNVFLESDSHRNILLSTSPQPSITIESV